MGGWGVRRAFAGVGWGGGVQVGRFGGYMPPKPSVGPSQAPLTSPPSNHTITLNLTPTFAANWFSHASHVDEAEKDAPNCVHGCFCHCSPFWTPTITVTVA